ncbi:MAG: LysE family translocator [Pseudomonadota bacterium]
MIEWLPLILGVFLAQVSPGPNLMAVSACAMGSGRGAGVLTAAGIASGAFIWALLFITGLGALLAAVPEALIAMKLLGGGYLMYLGVRALLASRRADARYVAGPTQSLSRAYWTGVMVVLTNPKAMAMWFAVSSYLAATGSGTGRALGAGAIFASSALVIYSTYAVLFSTRRVRGLYQRFFRVIETGFGAIFGLVGGRLMLDGLRELRN